MPIIGNRLAFTQENIEHAPDEPGVYVLYMDAHLVYYGSTELSVRSHLLDHLSGNNGKCTAAATVYGCEVVLKPAQRERDLLKEYKTAYGSLPLCNGIMAQEPKVPDQELTPA